MQRPNMVYAYFRFYIDEDMILAGLKKYCSEWEHMYEVGYNYREYKCFVDDAGGFQHWVGDMRGYTSYNREVGFNDASPSGDIFDQTIIMGQSRIIGDDITLLDILPVGTVMVFRHLTAADTGTDHKISFIAGSAQKITHPVMYVYDSTQVEIMKQVIDGITDESDVDGYEFMVDLNVDRKTGNMYDSSQMTITDEDKMFDGSIDTNAKFRKTGHVTHGYAEYEFDLSSSIHASLKITESGCRGVIEYYEETTSTWETLIDTGYVLGDYSESLRDVSTKKVKINTYTDSPSYTRTVYVKELYLY